MPTLPTGKIYRLWAAVGDRAVPCGGFRTRSDGTAVAQFLVPVESHTAPIGRLFVTVEPDAPGDTPAGPTVMEGRAREA